MLSIPGAPAFRLRIIVDKRFKGRFLSGNCFRLPVAAIFAEIHFREL